MGLPPLQPLLPTMKRCIFKLAPRIILFLLLGAILFMVVRAMMARRAPAHQAAAERRGAGRCEYCGLARAGAGPRSRTDRDVSTVAELCISFGLLPIGRVEHGRGHRE